jgi:hypothetical protein
MVSRAGSCEVIWFGVAKGVWALRIDRMGPDNYWFGARPQSLLDRRGAGVDGMFARRYRYRARSEAPQKAGACAAATSRCLTRRGELARRRLDPGGDAHRLHGGD